MNLRRLFKAALWAEAVGLLILVTLTGFLFADLRHNQNEIAQILDLKERVDRLSATSDEVVLTGADPAEVEAYRAEARAIRDALRQLEGNESEPRAAQAADQVAELAAATVRPSEATGNEAAAVERSGIEALTMAGEAQRRIQNVADQGLALDRTLHELIRERRRAVMTHVNVLVGAFAAAVVVLMAAHLGALRMLQRRFSESAGALLTTIDRMRDGDLSARAAISGSDECAQVARTLNRLADAQQAAQRDLDQYRVLIEASEDRFCIINSDYRYSFASDYYAALYGQERATLEGRHLLDVLSRDCFEREAKPPIDRALAGVPQAFEAERRYEHLGTRKFLIRYYPLPSADGTVNQVGGVVTDITALKEAEAQLREQRQLIELAARSARLGGWSVDLQVGEVEWSDTVAEIHGMPAGYTPRIEEGISFYASESRERIRALFTACAERGESYDEELQLIAATGEPVWVRTTGVPVRDDSGRIVRVEGALQDVSERRAREWQLRQMVHIVEQSPAAIVVTDTEGRIEYVNASAEFVSGYSSAELIGATPAVFQSGETDPAVYRELWETIQTGGVWQGEIRNRRKNGELFWEYEYISPITDDAGHIVNYVAIKEDISALKRIEDELRASRDELSAALETRQALINALPANIALLDSDGRVVDVNERWRSYGGEHESSDPDFGVGYNYIAVCEAAAAAAGPDGDDEGAAAVAAGLREILRGERDAFAEDYPCHSPGEQEWFRVVANRIGDDAATAGRPGVRAVVMHVDITERKRAEEALSRIAYEDRLTHVASREGFTEAVEQWRSNQGWQPHARVIMIDIHRLRDVNETYGFDAGDELLIAIARRLEASTPEGAVIGRAGGDEFMVFLPATAESAATAACEALTGVFAEPFPVAGVTFECHASFGSTRLGSTPRAAEDLLRETEIALFYAGGPQTSEDWRAYAPELEERSRQRIQITDELRRALARDEFELHFQPKVDLATGELIGAEALLRWSHPERGLQSPGLFVPIAEQSQLIGPIGNWVVNDACRRLRAWQDAGLDLVRLSVNVSVVQFAGDDFPQIVERALRHNGVAPSALTLEITESVFEGHAPSLHRQLHQLHAMGVHLSLDDFGTGYSSLLYLQQYPFDEIKIDQGFVMDMAGEFYKRRVVASVIAIADALGARVVAEGVESQQVADTLLAMDCHIGQGFYYSMPLASEDFEWLLANRAPLPLGRVPALHDPTDNE